jgi:flagellar hook-associated protein 2
VRVVSLASAARRVSGGFASDTAVIANAGDTLDIAFGGAAPISITVGAAGASLTDLRAAINADPNNDGSVRASVVFDGTGYRLLVNGVETGVANDVTVTTTIAGPGGAAFLDAAAGQDPADAVLEVFGLTVTRTSNTVTDLIPGVTLDLRATSASAIDIQVELDDEAVAGKLDTFANAYNEVVDFIKKQTFFDPEAKKSGPLAGDGVLRSIQFDIRNRLIRQYAFGTLNGLADIGVSLDKEGKLSVDRAKLERVLAQDSRAVRQVLGGSGASGGAASELALTLNEIVQPRQVTIQNSNPPKDIEVGLLPARGVALSDRIKELKGQITVMEARLAQREKTLVLQFSHLESLLAQLRNQGNSLSGITTPSSQG